ncbi:MAG: hypothetical protein K0S86_3901 [Geminicoccaceae bacterium]|nr:hypothetical protein [Geminicoccaceae bacterium]
MLVLDSGGVSRLAKQSRRSAALIAALRDASLWPPVVPSVVLVECTEGHAGRDALVNRLLKTCDVVEEVAERLARRAAWLRRRARRGSAVGAPSCQTLRARLGTAEIPVPTSHGTTDVRGTCAGMRRRELSNC